MGDQTSNPARNFRGVTHFRPKTTHTAGDPVVRVYAIDGTTEVASIDDAGNVQADGALAVTGAATVGGALGVTGAATLGSLRVNGGATLTGLSLVTVSVNLAEIAAGAEVDEAVSLGAGVAPVGSVVLLAGCEALTAGMAISGSEGVIAVADTVTVRVRNHSAAPINEGATNFHFIVLKV